MALGYIDEIMVEIVEVDPSQEIEFSWMLCRRNRAIFDLHHLGYLVDDFAATLQRAACGGLRSASAGIGTGTG